MTGVKDFGGRPPPAPSEQPGVTLVPIKDLSPCVVSLAWWPQQTAAVAHLASIVNEFRVVDEAGER